MADASLLVDLIISKYLYHLPFYRVIEIYKELGGTISASTINDWLKEVAGKVKPLYDLLRAHGLTCDYVQVDGEHVAGHRQREAPCGEGIRVACGERDDGRPVLLL